MDKTIEVNSYGEMLALVNNQDLIYEKSQDEYQGQYVAVTKEGDRLFFYVGYFGSCSGCDWLQDAGEFQYNGVKDYRVKYTDALEYCQQSKPKHIIPTSFFESKEKIEEFADSILEKDECER